MSGVDLDGRPIGDTQHLEPSEKQITAALEILAPHVMAVEFYNTAAMRGLVAQMLKTSAKVG